MPRSHGSLSDALGIVAREGGRWRAALHLYLRIVALGLLIAGLVRAGAILGMFGEFLAFDAGRRSASVALTCADLLAAVGLWIGAAWGPVMWGVAALAETILHTFFAGRFGGAPLTVAAHVVSFVVYLALVALDFREHSAKD